MMAALNALLFWKTLSKKKNSYKNLLIITWLSLFLVVAYTPEDYWTTKNVYGAQMFCSQSIKIKIVRKNYVLTTQSHT
jgi:hypothetical protein